MKKLGIPTGMLAFALFAVGGTAKAQVGTILKPVQIGAALGGAIPISDFGKTFNTGFNVTGTIGINPAGLPVGFRVDAAYNQFGAKGVTGVNAKIAGVSGNVVLNLASMASAGMTPYLIGGVGGYHVSSSVSGSTASNDFGFNAGAGVQIPLSGFATFIEARYNRISESGGSVSFVPITVGVMF